MAYKIQVHVMNEEPIVAEVEKLPAATDNMLLLQNPRTRDDKDLRNLAEKVTLIMLPLSRVVMIQILPTGEEEKVVGFVRE
jgi:hypothetical protein